MPPWAHVVEDEDVDLIAADVLDLLSSATAEEDAVPSSSHSASEVGKLMVCGGVSGALAKSATAPLARLTILYQVQALENKGFASAATANTAPRALSSLSIPKALQQIVKQEGLRSLYRGNLATIIHRVPYSAANFSTFEFVQRQLQDTVPNDASRALMAGASGGLVACTAAYPLDLLRTRLAAQTGTSVYYQGIRQAVQRIVREEGALGLYKGLGATLAQVVPNLALNFCFYDTFKRMLAAAPAAPVAHCATQPVAQAAPQALLASVSEVRSVQYSSSTGACSTSGASTVSSSSSSEACHEAGFKVSRTAFSGTESTSGQGTPSCSATPSSTTPSSATISSATTSSSATLNSLAAATAAGFCTSTLTYPLDLVRRRMQVSGRGTRVSSGSYLDTWRGIYASGGFRGLYCGITAEYCKVVPGMAIAFVTYEFMKDALGVQQQQQQR